MRLCISVGLLSLTNSFFLVHLDHWTSVPFAAICAQAAADCSAFPSSMGRPLLGRGEKAAASFPV